MGSDVQTQFELKEGKHNKNCGKFQNFACRRKRLAQFRRRNLRHLSGREWRDFVERRDDMSRMYIHGINSFPSTGINSFPSNMILTRIYCPRTAAAFAVLVLHFVGALECRPRAQCL